MIDELAETIRKEGGTVLATLLRYTGDFDLSEDALHDAIETALRQWQGEGIPANPAAWLTTVARRKALDHIRRESRRTHKETMAAWPDHHDQSDDVLSLFFTCCHPALSPESRVALTLRTLGGLTTAEIARSFLVTESTMGQRISRAKRKIEVANIPYRVPADHELPERLPAVLTVLNVIFTTGHHAPLGKPTERVHLSDEAIRLTRMLHVLMPDEPEVAGLLALMLATHARYPARFDEDGGIILLADQDRRLWRNSMIDEAAQLVERALKRRNPGRFQIQAAIACLHGSALDDASTDWAQISDLYSMLEVVDPGPVTTVNRSVAVSKVSGPEAALAVLESVEGADRWHLYWSVKGDYLRQLGRIYAARSAYQRALDQDMNDADRNFLLGRLRLVESSMKTDCQSG